MDLSLTDEQEFLREAARGTLSRFKIVEAAREAMDKGLSELPDLWPAAREAGWAGLLISEERGGAGLDVFDAMLVAEETGRVLAPVPFLGLIPATAILDAAGYDGLEAIAAGEVRPVWIPARPPGDLEPEWTVDGPGAKRPAAPTITAGEGDAVTVTGHAAYVVDAPGAGLLVVTGVDGTIAVVDAGAAGVTVEQVVRYDVTRALAHVTLSDAPGTRLAGDPGVAADAATSAPGALS
ncbi:MAG: acyl-CoA dehydrogenase, partial [Conexibacter sp.]|nr:acyl-CoA dehydrogenase [Conexibacter sp.]